MENVINNNFFLRKIALRQGYRYEVVNKETGEIRSSRCSKRDYVAATLEGDYYFGRLDLIGGGDYGRSIKHAVANYNMIPSRLEVAVLPASLGEKAPEVAPAPAPEVAPVETAPAPEVAPEVSEEAPSLTRISLAHTALLNEIGNAVGNNYVKPEELSAYINGRASTLKILYRLREAGHDFIDDLLLEELVENLRIGVGERKALAWVEARVNGSFDGPLRDFVRTQAEVEYGN